MTFKQLKVGSIFRFNSETEFPFSGMAKGPWKKTGPRSYEHTESGQKNTVGSINVGVKEE